MYRPEDFAGPRECEDLNDLAAIGWLPGTERAPSYIDPIEDDQRRPSGEDPRGIEIRRHPEAMLREDPELWRLCDRWRSGVRRELTVEEYETSSNFEIEAWKVLCAASNREEIRQIRKPPEGASDG